MMNNQYNAGNLTTPHGIQMAQHVAATSPPQQTPAAVLNTFYNAQHHNQQQQLAAAVAAAGGSLFGDPRQLQMSANVLDKAYYTTALGTPQRFYTTTAAPGTHVGAGNVASQPHQNTILITNNFTHQQATQPQSPPDHQRVATLNHPSNIRIVSSSGNSTNLVNTPGAYQHAQHVFNLGNTKTLQQLFPQHLLQQHPQNFHQAPDIITHQFAAQHFPEAQNATPTAAPIQMSQYYVAAPDAAQLATANTKVLGNTVTTTSGTSTTPTPLNVGVVNGGGSTNPNTSSTVVLDRINICINNLYTDTSSSSASNSLASTPAQQPSPIIPAIQHKTVVDSGILPILSPAGDVYDSDILVIDEPDSTTTVTTPHTPPTTPENTPPSTSLNCSNNNNSITTTTNSISSPSTSSTTIGTAALGQQDTLLSNNITNTKQNFAALAQNIELEAVQYSEKFSQSSTSAIMNSSTTLPSQILHSLSINAPLTPPTPPSPNITANTKESAVVDLTDSPSISAEPLHTLTRPSDLLFEIGEDVFIKRLDGRFYLGTVIDITTVCNQYLVRFDDKTKQWCAAQEMRKLGGGSSNSTTAAASNSQAQQPMCVACKELQPDSKVEICERCARGYHRQCTKETSSGSKVWLCKRCDKPMKLNMTIKLDLLSDDDSDVDEMGPRRLPYDLNSLSWDSKHRVNEEQIYCYCGKSGKFDDNMLQCCRCLNWYHTQCTSKFKGNLLRGDSFFVFSCSVCNEGEEFLRRLQLDWVDLVHLIIYNLSTMKKYQNHKYHHLLKDIYPFALEKRKVLPITQECLYMPENDYLNKIQFTLKENTERFVWGKEIKRDHYSFALRTNGPPASPKIPVERGDVLTDNLIVNNFKLKLLLGAPENSDVRLFQPPLKEKDVDITSTLKPKPTEDSPSRDIYAFADTSEDEIPIKLILDKVKNKNRITDEIKERTTPSIKPTLVAMDLEDDNANDLVLTMEPDVQDQSMPPTTSPKSEKKISPKKETKSIESSLETTSTDENITLLHKITSPVACIKYSGKTSRKRKGFNLSKTTDVQRLFDSSSDENSSSSSRGTSLDLIIPPPKNFLGQNNPFLIVTPKKKNDLPTSTSTNGSKKSVSFGIFNTSGLKFSSKLAALKSAGLFPKLSTSNLAKAAGQPRTVRTIKRRLSAKDITIGPNQEVRRRRTRRLSANIEVISTTTINPIPTNFFPIHAKDLLAAAAASTTTAASLFNTPTISSSPTSSPPSTTTINSITSSLPKPETSSNAVNVSVPVLVPTATDTKLLVPTSHGRRLRQRPPKCSPNTSRHSSVSSNQSSTSSSTIATPLQQHQHQSQNAAHQSHEELKQTVNKYFGIINRIESGEQFSIRAKRQLSNGQMQYLIEWGEQPSLSPQLHTPQKQHQLVEWPIKGNGGMILESDKGVEDDNANNNTTG